MEQKIPCEDEKELHLQRQSQSLQPPSILSQLFYILIL